MPGESRDLRRCQFTGTLGLITEITARRRGKKRKIVKIRIKQDEGRDRTDSYFYSRKYGGSSTVTQAQTDGLCRWRGR